MSRKRGNGEGSISHRADGRWQAQLTYGRDEHGRLIRKTKYGKTRAEARNLLEQMVAERDMGIVRATKQDTFGQRLHYWLYQKKKISVEEGTWTKYEINSRVHILPEFQDIPIGQITKPMVQEFITKKARELSPATVKILHMILHQVFEDAVDEGVILRNPAHKIDLPKTRPREVIPLTEDEMATILAACFGTRLYPVIFCEYGTGLRRSEILALTWDDVDFEQKTITVNKRYVRVGNRNVLQRGTKTAASNATIAVPSEVISFLQQLPKTSKFIFAQKDGQPLNPNNFRRDFKLKIEQLCKSGKLVGRTELHFHDLRHNYASQLVALNVHSRLIQAQMRHSDSRTTNRYAHTTLVGQQAAAEILNTRLKRLGCSKIAVKKNLQSPKSDCKP